MITNRRQLAVSRRRVEELRAHCADVEERQQSDATRLEAEAVGEVIGKLENEIKDYLALEGSHPTEIRVQGLEELPAALIRARIALGMTQRELAERLNLAESAIQRYEAQRYRGASVERISDVANAIGIPLVIESVAPGDSVTSYREPDGSLGQGSYRSLGDRAVRWLALPQTEALELHPRRVALAQAVNQASEIIELVERESTRLRAELESKDLSRFVTTRRDLGQGARLLSARSFALTRDSRRRLRESALEIEATLNRLLALENTASTLLDPNHIGQLRSRARLARDEVETIADETEESSASLATYFETIGYESLEDVLTTFRSAMSQVDHDLHDLELALTGDS
jgi:transcriptional regulator with XRE-family HTH domain